MNRLRLLLTLLSGLLAVAAPATPVRVTRAAALPPSPEDSTPEDEQSERTDAPAETATIVELHVRGADADARPATDGDGDADAAWPVPTATRHPHPCAVASCGASWTRPHSRVPARAGLAPLPPPAAA